jgi:hypothetical protein
MYDKEHIKKVAMFFFFTVLDEELAKSLTRRVLRRLGKDFKGMGEDVS